MKMVSLWTCWDDAAHPAMKGSAHYRYRHLTASPSEATHSVNGAHFIQASSLCLAFKLDAYIYSMEICHRTSSKLWSPERAADAGARPVCSSTIQLAESQTVMAPEGYDDEKIGDKHLSGLMDCGCQMLHPTKCYVRLPLFV